MRYSKVVRDVQSTRLIYGYAASLTFTDIFRINNSFPQLWYASVIFMTAPTSFPWKTHKIRIHPCADIHVIWIVTFNPATASIPITGRIPFYGCYATQRTDNECDIISQSSTRGTIRNVSTFIDIAISIHYSLNKPFAFFNGGEFILVRNKFVGWIAARQLQVA